VTIQTLTGGQPFSPPVLATQSKRNTVFAVGQKASFELKEISENGNNTPMLKLLGARLNSGSIYDLRVSPTLLVPAGHPGSQPDAAAPCNIAVFTPPWSGSAGCPDSWTTVIRANARNDRLSWVSMLVCTNDGFTGVDGLSLPHRVGRTVSVNTPAYDAGTEMNTERLADMVPPCQSTIGVKSPTNAPGTGASNPALYEGGVISPHQGIKGTGDLNPTVSGWNGPVGRLTVTRIR
jgi:hypothetical protein